MPREIPKHLLEDGHWMAALSIGQDVFGRDGRFWEHVDLERESIRFAEMMQDGTFSSGEQAMVQLAANLFNSSTTQVDVGALINTLGHKYWMIALRAIALRRGDAALYAFSVDQ